MTARIEAAAKALYAHNEAESVEAGAAFISMPPDEYDCCAKAAIEAADAIMFSDDAVERASKAAYEAQMEDGDTPWDHFGGSNYLDYWRDQARAVLAALKAV